jgi:hypothetical protein
MKYLYTVIFFLLPFVMNAQTIHSDDGEIVYKGKVSLADKSALQERVKNSLPSLVRDEEIKMDADTVRSTASIVLNSPYPLIRKVFFEVAVSPTEKGYAYRLDKFFVVEKERGGKTRKIPGAALLKNMEESGLLAQRTEEVLNEIDMRIQKLLAELKNDVTR